MFNILSWISEDFAKYEISKHLQNWMVIPPPKDLLTKISLVYNGLELKTYQSIVITVAIAKKGFTLFFCNFRSLRKSDFSDI